MLVDYAERQQQLVGLQIGHEQIEGVSAQLHRVANGPGGLCSPVGCHLRLLRDTL